MTISTLGSDGLEGALFTCSCYLPMWHHHHRSVRSGEAILWMDENEPIHLDG
jgi:hypothetical protein